MGLCEAFVCSTKQPNWAIAVVQDWHGLSTYVLSNAGAVDETGQRVLIDLKTCPVMSSQCEISCHDNDILHDADLDVYIEWGHSPKHRVAFVK